MSDEQRQEINRRQREYRARKKAESNQNSNNTKTVLHPTLLTPTFAGCNTQLCGQSPCLTRVSTVDQTQSLQDKENLILDDPDEWPHKNDNYIKQWKRRAKMSDEQRFVKQTGGRPHLQVVIPSCVANHRV